MKYTIVYGRKVRVKAYESMEVGYWQEFDEKTDPDFAMGLVAGTVERWIEKLSDKVLAAHGRRPEGE